MIVDCSTCVVRGSGCAGCMVTVLFGGVPDADLPWLGPACGPWADDRPGDDIETAIAVLTAAGMLHAEHRPVALVPVSPAQVASLHAGQRAG